MTLWIALVVCRLVRAQQSAALAVDIPIGQLRRGMVMTSPKGDVPTPCLFFQVLLFLLVSTFSFAFRFCSVLRPLQKRFCKDWVAGTMKLFNRQEHRTD